MRSGSLLGMSDRALKALQRIDRGKGRPVALTYNVREIDEYVDSWTRDGRVHYTLNRRGRQLLHEMKRPRCE